MNKYQYLWVVQGHYRFGWEDLTEADSWLEAKSLLRDYNENEPAPHRLIQRRIANKV
jgi:hypothetical protein